MASKPAYAPTLYQGAHKHGQHVQRRHSKLFSQALHKARTGRHGCITGALSGGLFAVLQVLTGCRRLGWQVSKQWWGAFYQKGLGALQQGNAGEAFDWSSRDYGGYVCAASRELQAPA